MTERHQSFGSISASFDTLRGLGWVYADGNVLHSAPCLATVAHLRDFWARTPAPSQGAILEALRWLHDQFQGYPDPREAPPRDVCDECHRQIRASGEGHLESCPWFSEDFWRFPRLGGR